MIDNLWNFSFLFTTNALMIWLLIVVDKEFIDNKKKRLFVLLIVLAMLITTNVAYTSFQNEEKLKAYRKYCKKHNLILIQKQMDSRYIVVGKAELLEEK